MQDHNKLNNTLFPRGREKVDAEAFWTSRSKRLGNTTRAPEETTNESGKPTVIKGLTIENCGIAIEVIASGVVLLLDVTIRNSGRGLLVSKGANDAILIIRRTLFQGTYLEAVRISLAERVKLRLEDTLCGSPDGAWY